MSLERVTELFKNGTLALLGAGAVLVWMAVTSGFFKRLGMAIRYLINPSGEYHVGMHLNCDLSARRLVFEFEEPHRAFSISFEEAEARAMHAQLSMFVSVLDAAKKSDEPSN